MTRDGEAGGAAQGSGLDVAGGRGNQGALEASGQWAVGSAITGVGLLGGGEHGVGNQEDTGLGRASCSRVQARTPQDTPEPELSSWDHCEETEACRV